MPAGRFLLLFGQETHKIGRWLHREKKLLRLFHGDTAAVVKAPLDDGVDDPAQRCGVVVFGCSDQLPTFCGGDGRSGWKPQALKILRLVADAAPTHFT